MQTLYLAYISDTQPHISTIFNKLELVNECSLVFLAYIMIAFSGVIQGQAIGNILAEFLAFIVTVIIVISNFYVLINSTSKKLKFRWRVFKAKRRAKLRLKARLSGRVACHPEELPQTDRTDRGPPCRVTDASAPQMRQTDPAFSATSTYEGNQQLDEAVECIDLHKRVLKTIDE